MRKWMKWAVIGGMVAASCQAVGREETWEVTVWPAPWEVEYKSTWQLTISETGEVTGVSTWEMDAGTGVTNTISGHISRDGQITLIRHIEGRNAGQTQTYSGQYMGEGQAAEGNTSGFDSPGSWVGGVTVKKL